MKSENIVRGRWWIDGTDKPPQAGTLDTSEDEITLSVWTPQNKSFDEMASSLALAHQPTKISAVITGMDEHNKPVTLFGCGTGGRSSSSGVSSLDINAITAVIGLKIESWQQPIARSVQFQIKYLHRWFGRQLLVAANTVDNKPGYSMQEPMDLSFPVEEGVQVRFTDQTSYSSLHDEHKYLPYSHIWFHFQKIRSLAEILDRWMPWATRLVGLLVGQSLAVEEITVFTGNPFDPERPPFEPRGTLLLKGGFSKSTRRESAPSSLDMLVPFESVRSQLDKLVAEWNRVSVTLEPVVALFGVVALQRALYLEAKFLFLVQALEVYHASSQRFTAKELPPEEREKMLVAAKEALPAHVWKWAKGKLSFNGRSLSQKLSDIFQAHQRESEMLLGDVELAASRIAYTRNHLTHHLKNLDLDRLIPEKEIFAASWSLEALLWIVLLREIGLNGHCVEEILSRVRGTTFVHIEG